MVFNALVLQMYCTSQANRLYYDWIGGDSMARTSSVYARVEPEIKEQAESVLDQLGIPMSNAVSMFLRQIVLQQGIPFEMKLPVRKPVAMGSLTKEEIDAEISKGMKSIEEGRVYSADAVEAEMMRDFGV